MKCKYCGSNLELENEVCPFCGRENTKAKKYVKIKNDYQKEFDETKQKVKKQVKVNARTGRVIFIALMLLVLAAMSAISNQYADVGTRIDNREQKLEQEVKKNINSISATLEDMEKNREYLKMRNYILTYSLSGHEEFDDYCRVFTAAESYGGIFNDILSIASGYDFFGERSTKDWCDSIARSVTTWNKYVEGEFWHDAADSPMHSGEHGAFLADAKVAVHDMVQVYFDLSDKQADAMWTMSEEELSNLLYEQYTSIHPEVSENE